MFSLTLQRAIDLYLLRGSSNGKGIADTTRSDNAKVLRYFVESGIEVGGIVIGPEVPVDAITPEHIDAYEYALCHRPRRLSSVTVFKWTYKVWELFRWLVKREKIAPEANPCRFMTPRRPPRDADSKAIPIDVLRDLVAEIRLKSYHFMIRDEAVLRCFASGLREGETRRLEIERLDLDTGVARVHRKGGWVQKRHLGPTTVKVLKAWLAIRPDSESNYVFVPLGRNKGSVDPMGEGVLSQIVTRISHKIGSQPYGSHALRHWFAQFMFDNGIALEVVAKSLGITVAVVLKHYSNQDDARVIQAINTCEFNEIGDGG